MFCKYFQPRSFEKAAAPRRRSGAEGASRHSLGRMASPAPARLLARSPGPRTRSGGDGLGGDLIVDLATRPAVQEHPKSLAPYHGGNTLSGLPMGYLKLRLGYQMGYHGAKIGLFGAFGRLKWGMKNPPQLIVTTGFFVVVPKGRLELP